VEVSIDIVLENKMIKENVMTWKLDDLVAENGFDDLLMEVESLLPQYVDFFEQMHPGIQGGEFGRFIEFEEEVVEGLKRLEGYSDMMVAASLTSGSGE